MILASGTAVAQIISLIFTPLITRLYGPEAFGVMGTFMSIISIITPIAALTYPIAIVLPKYDHEAKGIVKLSIYITMVVTIFCATILVFFKDLIVGLFNLESVASYLFLIPLAILFSGVLQVIEQWMIRTKQFKVSAKAAVIQIFLLQGGKAGVGYFYPTATVLIVLSVVASGVKVVLMLIFSKINLKKLLYNNKSQKNVSLNSLLKKYKDFPLFRSPEVFINAISQSLPILLLTSFFGPASAGFYSIGKSILGLPSQLIGKSVGDVFYPRISEAANNKEKLTPLIKKSTLLLAVIGVIPFSLVGIFGPMMFSFVFGEEWITAGHYARWIALWSYFAFINRPSVVSLPILSAQGFQLTFTIIMLLIRTLSLLIGYILFSSDVVAIALFSISGAFLNIVLIILTLKKSQNYDER
jgi:O-antigen/teichoic acid export membrane protein